MERSTNAARCSIADGDFAQARWTAYDAEFNVRGALQKCIPDALAQGLFAVAATGSSMHFRFECIAPDEIKT